MKQTIKFLDVLDIERNKTNKLNNTNLNFSRTPQTFSKQLGKTFSKSMKTTISKEFKSQPPTRRNKYPFFKALNFKDEKFQHYPKWLTEREDFMNFMYKNYQQKLLTIPKLCQKSNKASDEKYFVSLYLQQIEMFKNIPPLVMDIILAQIKSRTYQAGQFIHSQVNDIQFMGVIFAGRVEFIRNRKIITKQRNDVILSQAFYKTQHPTILAKEETVLLYLQKSVYQKIQSELKSDLYEKNRAQISDMMKSDFFIQLHLKEKRAKTFYEELTPQIYFKGEQICQAGQTADKFYLHFKGEVLEKNHIYIRQHNKWPLPNRKWEVRAVYNSYENETNLKHFSFFGDEEIIGNFKFKSSYIAQSFCILFSMPAEKFKVALSSQDLKRLKKYRNEHVDINYTQFEHKVRHRIKSQMDTKKIIHKAFDTSFANRSFVTPKKAQLLTNVERNMLSKSFAGNFNKNISFDHENQQNQFAFKL